jgi:hypothetical protein
MARKKLFASSQTPWQITTPRVRIATFSSFAALELCSAELTLFQQQFTWMSTTDTAFEQTIKLVAAIACMRALVAAAQRRTRGELVLART